MAGRRFCSGCRGLCRVRVRLYLPADFLRPADSKPSGFRAPTQILATEAMQKRRPKLVASGRHRLPRRGGRATAAPRSRYRRAAVALSPRRGRVTAAGTMPNVPISGPTRHAGPGMGRACTGRIVLDGARARVESVDGSSHSALAHSQARQCRWGLQPPPQCPKH